MTTATKAPPVESAEKILNRIRDLFKNHNVTNQKIRRQKVELYRATHLYVERCMADDNTVAAAHVHKDLAAKVGGTVFLWQLWYRAGAFIHNNRIDPEQIQPGALSQAITYSLDSKTLNKVVNAINDGANHKKITTILQDSGISGMRRIPEWRKKEIRSAKKEWKDWQPELEALLSGISMTTDGKKALQLVLTVGGKRVVVASCRSM